MSSTHPSQSIAQAILTVQDAVRGFGGQPVLEGISLSVHEGDRIGLTGRNGVGKSTLLHIMAGLDTPDSGLVTSRQGLRVGLLEQQCRLDPGLTVGRVLEEADSEIRGLLDQYHEATHALAHTEHDSPDHDRLRAMCADLQHRLDLADGWNPGQGAKRLSTALALPPPDRSIGTLSGGELRRVDLAATLLRRPGLLLLDEPTNQIDARSVAWLETFLEQYSGSLVLVTHDRYFLDRVVNRIVELEHGHIHSFPGNYTRFLEYKTSLEEQEAREETNRKAFLRRELEWLKRGPKARSTKQKARIQRYYNTEGHTPPPSVRELEFAIPSPQRLGKRILEAQNIRLGFGDRVLFKDFSLIMQKHMRIGIIGPNGCGKTTLLRVLMGEAEPDSGEIRTGDNTQFLYVDQKHEDLDPNETILRYVSEGVLYWDVGPRRLYMPSYLEQFLFDRDSMNMPMKNLSGGEVNRIVLARKLLRGGNFLILDEPTNDLDLPTLRILEEAIDAFDGCALVVTHDRYFLNRVCTHVLSFEGDGNVVMIAGDYDDYLLYKERLEEEAAQAEKAKGAAKTVQPRSAPKKRSGLTWKEKKELENMEAALESAEAEVVRLEQEVSEPDFYRQQPDQIKAALSSLEEAKQQVEGLYARWEELEQRAQAS